MIVRTRPATPAARLRRAFTLLEVLVVMAILLILAGSATFAAVSYLGKAKVNEAKMQMAKIESAVKAYHTQNNLNYPDSLAVLINPPDNRPLLEGGETAIMDPWGKPYQMSIVPDNTGTERVVITTTDDKGATIRWPEK